MTTDLEGPEEVASLLNEQEAAAVIDYLCALGITAHRWGANLTSAWGEGIPRDVIQVVVGRAEAERARQALAEFRHDRAEVNWDEVDVGNPE